MDPERQDGERAPSIPGERVAVRGEVSRFQALVRVGYGSALTLHCLFMAAFLAIGETALAAFNVVSVATYVAALLLQRRGHVQLPVLAAWAEVIAHQTWATLVFGLESGFHYYLLVIMICVALLPSWRAWRRAVFALVPLFVLAGLVLNGLVNAPLRPPPGGWELAFQLGNLIGLAAVLVAIVLSYASAAASAEEAHEIAYVESERLLDNILPRPISARVRGSSTAS